MQLCITDKINKYFALKKAKRNWEKYINDNSVTKYYATGFVDYFEESKIYKIKCMFKMLGYKIKALFKYERW